MNKNLIIGGALAVVVALAVSFAMYQKAQAPGPVATSTSQATSTPPQEPPPTTPLQDEGPSISTTPYTVYLGGATKFGTSSEELMAQEGTQVVVGYEWEALSPGPQFDSIAFPLWDPNEPQKTYELYVWDEENEAYGLQGEYPAGQEIQFPRDGFRGASKFKVLGIDPKQRICPGDRSFNWTARFTLPGAVGLVRTPITQELFVVSCKMR